MSFEAGQEADGPAPGRAFARGSAMARPGDEPSGACRIYLYASLRAGASAAATWRALAGAPRQQPAPHARPPPYTGGPARAARASRAVGREIKIATLFSHPHIVRIYEVIKTAENIYVVMEYVKAGELFDYIVEKGRLHEDEARNFFQQVRQRPPCSLGGARAPRTRHTPHAQPPLPRGRAR